MSKTIPSVLQSHYDEPVNTTAFLLRIVKNTGHAGATEVVGISSLDADLAYDDGDGSITYQSSIGVDPSALENTADLSVDNADGLILLSADSLDPNTVEEIEAGRFDSAEFVLYKVNWNDLTTGRHEIVHFGTLGECKVVSNGLACMIELRGQSQQFKQNVGYRDTRDCPATFGSQSGEERLYCGFDATTLLIAGTVTAVGVEANSAFTDSALGQATDFFVPGLVFWQTGRNAGTAQEIEAFQSGGIVALRFDTPYPIEIGDTFNIRRDCNKRARDADKGCLHWFPTDWVLHFRGCPDIPTGDAARLSTPGASAPPGNSGSFAEIAP